MRFCLLTNRVFPVNCTEFAPDPTSFRVRESMSDRAQYIFDDETRATARDRFRPNVQPRILRSARFLKIRSFAGNENYRYVMERVVGY